MKKNFLLLLSVLALSLSFANCSKEDVDDANDKQQKSLIIGTWLLDIDESIFDDIEGLDKCFLDTSITFHKNGLLTIEEGCTNEEDYEEEEEVTIKWEVNKNKLKISPADETLNEDPIYIDIKLLDENSLVLLIPEDDELNGEVSEFKLKRKK